MLNGLNSLVILIEIRNEVEPNCSGCRQSQYVWSLTNTTCNFLSCPRYSLPLSFSWAQRSAISAVFLSRRLTSIPFITNSCWTAIKCTPIGLEEVSPKMESDNPRWPLRSSMMSDQ